MALRGTEPCIIKPVPMQFVPILPEEVGSRCVKLACRERVIRRRVTLIATVIFGWTVSVISALKR